ncbi:MAG TPA: GH116 family glycosyl-hydrolase [Microlunatus sp.]
MTAPDDLARSHPGSGSTDWPSVRSFRDDDLAKVAMPVGGIGTGCVSLGGRGQLIDWELFNRPAKGHNPQSFFAVRVEDSRPPAGRAAVQARLLERALLPGERDGAHGSPVPLAGMPRFRDAVFDAAYPLGQVTLTDPAVPVQAVLQVFNPLVPGNADASGLPLLVYRVSLHNLTDRALRVSVCGNLQNVIGTRPGPDGGFQVPPGNVFEPVAGAGYDGLAGHSTQVDEADEAWGTLAIALAEQAATSRRTNWAGLSWGDSLLDFWDDFAGDGQVDEPSGKGAGVPTASLVASGTLEPGSVWQATYLISWRLPNRRGWRHDPVGPPDLSHSDDIVGNHYAGRFRDAVDVIDRVVPDLDQLESATVAAVRSVVDSDLPRPVADAVLSNLAVLKSPTCFRIADGTFLGWEGCNPRTGSCHGSCTHVWNYQYALEQLFGDLGWSMREVEFVHSLDDRGLMSFRAGLPLETEGTGWRIAAADGQMGALVRLHRTWRLTGDTERLRELWPNARRALEFAWIEKGWDADRDGLMEGCQHNTMDVEYYGPSGVNQSWYLAALAACSELAAAVGDDDFGKQCRALADEGARRTDELLFVGGYYAQDIRPPGSADNIAEGLRIRYEGENPAAGSDDLVDPDLQIGSGCTTDQVVGHTVAAMSGVATGLAPANVRQALASVIRHNRRDGFTDHVNHLRTYATDDERGMINCSFPRGNRPERPFPYCYEVWTGLEYSLAVGLAVEGDLDTAASVVVDARDRHDGRSRNPFNETECGNHYVRSMASFGLLHAWSGAVIDATADRLTVAARPGRWPIVVGNRVGQVVVEGEPQALSVRYEPILGPGFGTVEIRS